MALDLAKVVLEIRKTLNHTVLHANHLWFLQLSQKIKPRGILALSLLLAVYGPGLGPDGPGCPEKP